MESITKASVSEEQVRELAVIAGLGTLTKITELTGGEFNLAFMLEANGSRYVLKIGPNSDTKLLRYEYGIMDVEVGTYNTLTTKTNIPVPKIIHFGRELIGNQWFIMTEVPGKLFSESELSDEAKQRFYKQFGGHVASMHKIHGERFGHAQIKTHASWKEAYYEMVLSMLDDAERQGAFPPGCGDILRYIRKYDYVLDDAKTPCLVHFDLFDNNIFTDSEGNFTGLIDTERSVWADPYAEFVAISPFGGFFEKTDFIEGYNAVAEEKICDTLETRARLGLMRMYLGVLMFVESATRLHQNTAEHWQRKHWAAMLINMAWQELDALEK